MVKLVFFVHCSPMWKTGGYENTHYFETEKQAREWADREGVDIRRIETVSQKEFSADFMGGCY